MYRNGVRLLFTLCVGASALSLAPAARAGVLVAVHAVNGVETGFQQDAGGPGSDLSQFAGLLTGQLTGVFTADVFHAPNPSIVGTSAAVTGGTISVSNLFASTALTGSITSGSVTLAAEDPGWFRVGVQIAGLRGTAKGSVVTGGVGAASIWLTHYRTLVLTASGFRCLYIAFWRRFLDRVHAEHPDWTRARAVGPYNWFEMRGAIKGTLFSSSFSQNRSASPRAVHRHATWRFSNTSRTGKGNLSRRTVTNSRGRSYRRAEPASTLVGTITGIPPDSGVSFTLTTSP